MLIQMQVHNSEQFKDGDQVETLLAQWEGGLLTNPVSDPFEYRLRRGQMFKALSPQAGLVIPATGTGAITAPAIWNPDGSAVIAIIVMLEIGWITGAEIPGSFEWDLVPYAGNMIATAAAISSWVDTPAVNALVGSSKTKPMKIRCSNAYTCATTAPAYMESAGLSMETALAASTNAEHMIQIPIKNMAILPGNMVTLLASQANTTAKFQTKITFFELPLPMGTW